jgi:hypothetical protein
MVSKEATDLAAGAPDNASSRGGRFCAARPQLSRGTPHLLRGRPSDGVTQIVGDSR